MKRIYNIFAIAAVVLSLASCDHVSKFNSVTFASFTDNSTNKTILENVESFNIPVAVYDNTGTCTVTFEVKDPNNAKGVAYTVEPTNGVLTFNGNETKNIVIKPINRPDDISGNIPFSIELTSITNGGVIGTSSTYNLAIADYVPVTWNFITGTWHATDYDGTTYDVEIAKVDDETLTLENLWDAGETITGTIEFNEEENTALITFASMQVMYNSGSYGPVGIFGLTETGKLDSAAYATVDAGGITLGPWIAVILTGTYQGYSFDDGGLTTFSK